MYFVKNLLGLVEEMYCLLHEHVTFDFITSSTGTSVRLLYTCTLFVKIIVLIILFFLLICINICTVHASWTLKYLHAFPYARGNIGVCSFMPKLGHFGIVAQISKCHYSIFSGKFLLPNWNLQCWKNIVSLGKLEAEIKYLIRLSSSVFFL